MNFVHLYNYVFYYEELITILRKDWQPFCLYFIIYLIILQYIIIKKSSDFVLILVLFLSIGLKTFVKLQLFANISQDKKIQDSMGLTVRKAFKTFFFFKKSKQILAL